MKKIFCIVISAVMLCTAYIVPTFATSEATVNYIENGNTAYVVENLKSGEQFNPNRAAAYVPEDMYFVGWKTKDGKTVNSSGIKLEAGTNNLYAVYSEECLNAKNAYISKKYTDNSKIFLPYTYSGTYYSQINYELNGGYGPKEEIEDGNNGYYTKFISGEYNGRGATLLFDENSNALLGRWNTEYEITFKYRIPSIESSVQMQPVFGIKKENAQNINSDGIKDNILTVGHSSDLISHWGYDITTGTEEYWFTNNKSADESQYNIVTEGFSEWKSVTFTVKTGTENSNYLPVFGIYVNVGGGYNKTALEIKDITVTDKYTAQIKYILNGSDFGTPQSVEEGSLYYIDRVPENTDTYYFAGWYTDSEFKNQARSSFTATGKTVLYAKMLKYSDSLTVESSAETGSGWEAYKHSVQEKNWYCYRILAGAYGINNGKYGDLLDEGQSHRHYGSENDGNTAIADENGLKHETRDRNNRIWQWHPNGDYILRDENGEAFIVKPNTAYKVTLTYSFDNSLNTSGTAIHYLGTGLSCEKLLGSGNMSLTDLGEPASEYSEFLNFGIDDNNDEIFAVESEKTQLIASQTDKTVTMFITTPSLQYYKDNNLLQVLAISDTISEKCSVKWKDVTVEMLDTQSIIGNAGVSMLKNSDKTVQQALRYYFTYDSSNGNDILLGDTAFTVQSRGILLAKGLESDNLIKRENSNGKQIIDINTEEAYKCWSAKTYENGNEKLYFSCYVTGLDSENGDYNYSDRIYARGYVVLKSGDKLYTLYSNPSSYIVKEVAELNSYNNEGDYKVVTQGGRELVWNIEFEDETDTAQLKDKLNTSVTTMSPDNQTLFTSNKSDNYFIDNGDLVLRITKNGNNTYTTANSLTTRDRMSFKYGYLEMRAMVPYKRSVWPSFWMQPDKNLLAANFKYYGEIDIFEVFGSRHTATFNLHKWYDGYAGTDTIGNRGNYTGSLNYKFSDYSNLSNEYHIYGFEWTPDYMKVYIDGECYYQVSIKNEDDYSTEHPGMACFRDYYYLCWNNWLYSSEVSDGSLEAPVDYRIDYVRLYQNPKTEYIKIYK